VFGRSKTTNAKAGPAVDPAHPVREGAKNRPTPTRKEQEAKRRQPLVVTDRKAAREQDRAKRRESQVKMRQAMVTGDDRYLPVRDKGPVKRFIRDYVDARRNVGEFLLPVMVVVLAMTFLTRSYPGLYLVIFVLTYGIIAVGIIDAWLMWRGLKRRLADKFGAGSVPKGSVMYSVMRAMQMRRTRQPRPQVSRGQYPS
jgi:hypothetical protein